MTKKEFQDYMEIVFDNLENAESYYWCFLNQVKQFEFITRLSYLNGFINASVLSKTLDWTKKVKEKYNV